MTLRPPRSLRPVSISLRFDRNEAGAGVDCMPPLRLGFKGDHI